MMGEKISIITISFNSEKTIEKTLDSVLEQSYRPLEYVLIDGASTDKTLNIINSYIPKFNEAGIEVSFRSKPDKGISDAFNKGIERATGSIIGIINSDDRLTENALNYIALAFEKDTDVVCGDCLWIDDAHDIQYIRKSKMKLNKLKYEMVLMHPTCFVRKSTYEKHGVFDISLKYAMDKDLMARFYRKGARFKYTPHVISIMSAGGASDNNAIRVYKEGVTVAIRNGVPKWFADIRWRLLFIRMKGASLVKKNKIIWEVVHNCQKKG